MRKAITLIFYLLMILIGCWSAYEWLILGGRGIAFKFGAFLALFGLYLLWNDFLSVDKGKA
jgi:hypothetical protein